MVQLNDTVPHTVNIVTAGNPPGQPIEVALEAGKTVSFPMPEKIPMTPMPFLNGGTHTTGGGLNFKAEPISSRLAANPDSSKLFSTAVHGDPYTPMLRAYLGDTVVFRLLQTMANETMVWTVSGHTYLTERYAGDANRKNSIHIGIAERYDLVVPQAGGPRLQAGDYIHLNGRMSKFSEGAWGIMRVLDKEVPDLQKLPAGYSRRDEIPKPLAVCPSGSSGEKLQRRGVGLSFHEVESQGTRHHRGRLRADDPDGQSERRRFMRWKMKPRRWPEALSRCR